MKQASLNNPLVQQYLAQIEAWDAKHRIIGDIPAKDLYLQSLEALSSYSHREHLKNVVDFGAGSGILGICALLEGISEKMILVEPAPKKASFLRLYKASLLSLGDKARQINQSILVVDKRLQDVSRETVEQFFRDKQSVSRETPDYSLIARAFSGTLTLEDVLGRSDYKDIRTLIFSDEGSFPSKKYMLKEIKT